MRFLLIGLICLVPSLLSAQGPGLQAQALAMLSGLSFADYSTMQAMQACEEVYDNGEPNLPESPQLGTVVGWHLISQNRINLIDPNNQQAMAEAGQKQAQGNEAAQTGLNTYDNAMVIHIVANIGKAQAQTFYDNGQYQACITQCQITGDDYNTARKMYHNTEHFFPGEEAQAIGLHYVTL